MAVYTDNFTYSDGALAGKGNWALPSSKSGLQVISNQLAGVSGTFLVNYYNATTADKHYAKLTVPTVSSGGGQAIGVCVRIQSTGGDAYYFLVDGPDGYYGRINYGDYGGPVGGTWANGDVVGMEIDAAVSTTIYLKKNDSTIYTWDLSSDPNGGGPLTGGYAGVGAYSGTVSRGDNWEGGDVGGTVALSRMALMGFGD